jgi:large subunit ribosomal protein L31
MRGAIRAFWDSCATSGTLFLWTGSRHHWHDCTSAADPATHLEEITLKKDLHPTYVETQVTCSCGNTFTTRSTAKSGVIHADVCSQCHPFYTGKQKILDTGGRVARFEARYGKKAAK